MKRYGTYIQWNITQPYKEWNNAIGSNMDGPRGHQAVLCWVAQVCPTLCNSMDCSPPGSSVAILQARIIEWIAMPSSRGCSQPRNWTQVSHVTGRFFNSEPSGKPKNTGVGSLSILHGISLTQELNWCLFPCKQILYQRSHQRSPEVIILSEVSQTEKGKYCMISVICAY